MSNVISFPQAGGKPHPETPAPRVITLETRKSFLGKKGQEAEIKAIRKAKESMAWRCDTSWVDTLGRWSLGALRGFLGAVAFAAHLVGSWLRFLVKIVLGLSGALCLFVALGVALAAGPEHQHIVWKTATASFICFVASMAYDALLGVLWALREALWSRP